MSSNVIAWPGSPQHHRAALTTELQRLQQMEVDLSRPVHELATELAHLRAVADAAREAMGKVDEHDRRGYEHIRIGAFTALRTALDRWTRG